jgi:hypothetical protein
LAPAYNAGNNADGSDFCLFTFEQRQAGLVQLVTSELREKLEQLRADAEDCSLIAKLSRRTKRNASRSHIWLNNFAKWQSILSMS